MNKFFIDTSTLIRHPNLFIELNNTEIIIHNLVLEELDKISKTKGIKGENARKVISFLYKVRNRGDFHKGIKIDTNIIKIDNTKPNIDLVEFGLEKSLTDNLLLSIALTHFNKDNTIRFITYDKLLNIKSNNKVKTICLDYKINKNKRNKRKKIYKNNNKKK